MLPELLVHHLTGEVVAERTSAGTTGWSTSRSGTWSEPLAEAAGLDPALLPGSPPPAPGSGRGRASRSTWWAATTPPRRWPWARPGGGPAFVSAGTWLLVGVRATEPDLGARPPGATTSPTRSARWAGSACSRTWPAPGWSRAAARPGATPDRRVIEPPAAAVDEPDAGSTWPTPGSSPRRHAGRGHRRPGAAGRTPRRRSWCAASSSRRPRGRRRPRPLGARADGRSVRRAAPVVPLPVPPGRAGRAGHRRPRGGDRRATPWCRASPSASIPTGWRRHEERRGDEHRGGRPAGADRAAGRSAGRVKVTELAVELDVSEMTIRRPRRAGRAGDGAARPGRRRGHRAPALRPAVQPPGPGQGPHRRQAGAAGGRRRRHRRRRLVHPAAPGRPPRQVRSSPWSPTGRTRSRPCRTPGVTALLTGGQLDRRTGSLVGPLATRAAREVLLRRLFVSAAPCTPARHLRGDAGGGRGQAGPGRRGRRGRGGGRLQQARPGGPGPGLPPERVDLLVTELDPADPALDPYRDRWRIL